MAAMAAVGYIIVIVATLSAAIGEPQVSAGGLHHHHNNYYLNQQQPHDLPMHRPHSMQWESAHGGYSKLLFTFDQLLSSTTTTSTATTASSQQRLQLESLIVNLQALVQDTSALMYEALNGRAYINDIQVLVPYKWNGTIGELLPRPGSPVLKDRRVKYDAADILIGFDDPALGQTPFALQHDECGKQALRVNLPASFVASNELSARLKARALLRELASYRYGVFKESGFRHDPLYPPFASLAGFSGAAGSASSFYANNTATRQNAVDQLTLGGAGLAIRGFDEQLAECRFDTAPGSGLPLTSSAGCLPFLVDVSGSSGSGSSSSGAASLGLAAGPGSAATPPHSLNIMNADPFLWTGSQPQTQQQMHQSQPQDRIVSAATHSTLVDSIRWHFCGSNFAPPAAGVGGVAAGHQQGATESFAHNQLALNKQNLLCNERSAMDVIRAHDDFRSSSSVSSSVSSLLASASAQTSPVAAYNRLPQTQVHYVQEAPPRVIIAVEYSQQLMLPSKRHESGVLDAAIVKFVTLDLIADADIGFVWYGNHKHDKSAQFKKLDANLDARPLVYSLRDNPWNEPTVYYSDMELASLGIVSGVGGTSNSGTSGGVRATISSFNVTRGFASFATMMNEAAALLSTKRTYDDEGADLVIVTSGLFVEDDARLEEVVHAFRSRLAQVTTHLIVYPSSALFDTTGLATEQDASLLIKHRLSRLALIERVTGARLHLIREQLDATGDVRVSTLTQLHDVFEKISKGNSWDSSDGMLTIARKQLDSTSFARLPLNHVHHNQTGSSHYQQQLQHQHQLEFKFNVDATIQNELIVGFLDAGAQSRRFALRNLKLRGPSGALLLCDGAASSAPDYQDGQDGSLQEAQVQADSQTPMAFDALFAYRTQIKLAGFHLRAPLLARLARQDRLAGVWTLTASADEPLTTSGVAWARASPHQNTTLGSCWLQPTLASSGSGDSVDIVGWRVFARVTGAPSQSPAADVVARFEVLDEAGNLVQNAEMLDDGLAAPDITRGDGVHSAQVTRARRFGFYRVNVELRSGSVGPWSSTFPSSSSSSASKKTLAPGQDVACCGSVMPVNNNKPPSTRHLSRQLYCGTFFVSADQAAAVAAAGGSKVRLPAIRSLSVVGVDQDARRVTLRWLEPALDLASVVEPSTGGAASSSSPPVDYSVEAGGSTISKHLGKRSKASAKSRRAKQSQQQQITNSEHDTRANNNSNNNNNNDDDDAADQLDVDAVYDALAAQTQLVSSSRSITDANLHNNNIRYEFKLFTDREAARNAFDARPDVGFSFTEWHLDGAWPNASHFGGAKTATLRVPFPREGIYYIAMRVRSTGTSTTAASLLASPPSNIVQFWLRNNLTGDELDAIVKGGGAGVGDMSGAGALVIDDNGNVYDRNGELVRSAPSPTTSNNLLLRLDGLALFVLVGVAAFLVSAGCVALVVCLAHSARHSLKARKHSQTIGNTNNHDSDDDRKPVTGAGGGGSSASESSASSQQSEPASSSAGSTAGGIDGATAVTVNIQANNQGLDAAKLGGYAALAAQHQQQQQQMLAELQQRQHLASPHYDYLHAVSHKSNFAYQFDTHNQQQQSIYQPPGTDQWLAYSYQQQPEPPQTPIGDVNENGLGVALGPLPAWSSSVMLGGKLVPGHQQLGGDKHCRRSSPALEAVRVELDHQQQLMQGASDEHLATHHFYGAQHDDYYANQGWLPPPPVVPRGAIVGHQASNTIGTTGVQDEYACVEKSSAVSRV